MLFLQCFLKNKGIKALFLTLQIIDHIIYTSGEFPVQTTLFAFEYTFLVHSQFVPSSTSTYVAFIRK